MRLGFRHGDPRFPFFWEGSTQPPARWHAAGEGPVQYLADTPDGAWAEFLRHEEIHDAQDLPGVRRRMWVVEVDLGAEQVRQVALQPHTMTGDVSSYPACQAAARRLRADGATCLLAPSAALLGGGARGQVTEGGLREAAERDGVVWAVAGVRPRARGWATVDAGAPPERVLRLVRHFTDQAAADTSPGPGASEARAGTDRRQDDRRTVLDLVRAERGDPERRVLPAADRRSAVRRRS